MVAASRPRAFGAWQLVYGFAKMCVRICVCMSACMHAQIPPCSLHAYIHAYNTHMCVNMYIYTHADAFTCIGMHTHTFAYIHAYIPYIHTNIRTYIHKYIPSYSYIYVYAHRPIARNDRHVVGMQGAKALPKAKSLANSHQRYSYCKC